MGIPSYFVHLVRKYRDVLKPVTALPGGIDNLYMDCNSLIYDALRHLEKNGQVQASYEPIISAIVAKLVYHLKELKPKQRAFLAFDGVAPLAKLDQQRKRRFLSWFEEEKTAELTGQQTKVNPWPTAMITPGTRFMQELAIALKARFNNAQEFGLTQLRVSPADEPGEGEAKLFEAMRDDPSYHASTTTVVYGLDADLIMLTLNHLRFSNQLYLYRETPEFIKHIDRTLDPSILYYLDIPKLGYVIRGEMTGPGGRIHGHLIQDYVLLCFFLGNDFLPHFPALNIRKHGIQHLLQAYRYLHKPLTNHLGIHWRNLREFVAVLAAHEHEWLVEEYTMRQQQEKQVRLLLDPTQPLLHIPLLDRGVETYINPTEHFWEHRYYRSLLHIEAPTDLPQVCKTYLAGLDWNLAYYTRGCVDWLWHYPYHYAPLLQDLVQYMPSHPMSFFTNKPSPVAERLTPTQQLVYVLPKARHAGLLPPAVTAQIPTPWQPENPLLLWAFMKYFWETHVCLPDIPLKELKKIQ